MTRSPPCAPTTIATAPILTLCGMLGPRPRSRNEIERALRAKRFEEPVIEAAVERLTVEGLLDDVEFARFWSENRTTFRPRGARALRYELRLKGVANEDMEPALAAVDEDEAAWSAIEPQGRRMATSPRRRVQAEGAKPPCATGIWLRHGAGRLDSACADARWTKDDDAHLDDWDDTEA